MPRQRGPGPFYACGRAASTVAALSRGHGGWNNEGAIAAMVIVWRNRKVNRMSQTDETPAKCALLPFCGWRGRNLFTPDSSRYLNCPSNLIGHDHPNKPANGEGITGRFNKWTAAALGTGRSTTKREMTDVSGAHRSGYRNTGASKRDPRRVVRAGFVLGEWAFRRGQS